MAEENFSILERSFWRHINVGAPDACWEWTYMRSAKGYGKCRIGHSTALAHRIAYELKNGPLPAPVDGKPVGGVVLHLCHNPPCCNPAHLRLGTQMENVQMMVEAGRARGGGVSTTASPIVVGGREYPTVMAAVRGSGLSRGRLRGSLKRNDGVARRACEVQS